MISNNSNNHNPSNSSTTGDHGPDDSSSYEELARLIELHQTGLVRQIVGVLIERKLLAQAQAQAQADTPDLVEWLDYSLELTARYLRSGGDATEWQAYFMARAKQSKQFFSLSYFQEVSLISVNAIKALVEREFELGLSGVGGEAAGAGAGAGAGRQTISFKNRNERVKARYYRVLDRLRNLMTTATIAVRTKPAHNDIQG